MTLVLFLVLLVLVLLNFDSVSGSEATLRSFCTPIRAFIAVVSEAEPRREVGIFDSETRRAMGAMLEEEDGVLVCEGEARWRVLVDCRALPMAEIFNDISWSSLSLVFLAFYFRFVFDSLLELA